MVDDISSVDVIEIKNELSKHNLGSLEIKLLAKNTDEEIKSVVDAKSILDNRDDMLERFLEITDLNGMDKEVLLEIGRTIYASYQEENS